MTNLDSKIASEMSALKEKIESMQKEMEVFNRLEEIKIDYEDTKKVCFSAVFCAPQYELVIYIFFVEINLCKEQIAISQGNGKPADPSFILSILILFCFLLTITKYPPKTTKKRNSCQIAITTHNSKC